MEFYRHYKGGIYILISEALHTETHEELIIYKNTEGEVFARPLDMFFGKVTVDGKEINRFERVSL